MKLTKGLSIAGVVLGIVSTLAGATGLVLSIFSIVRQRDMRRKMRI